MKLGIISDIHGDFNALETVLNRFDTYHHVDQILCAGDLVGRGPEPVKVVDALKARNALVVRGNHDEWVHDLPEPTMDYLADLPLEWTGEFAGQRIFLCHGKPGNNIWGLYRDHVSDTLLNMMLESLNVDVLITGHTHMPMSIQVARGNVINPGSLYTFDNTRSSSQTYGVLTLPESHFELFTVQSATDIPSSIPF